MLCKMILAVNHHKKKKKSSPSNLQCLGNEHFKRQFMHGKADTNTPASSQWLSLGNITTSMIAFAQANCGNIDKERRPALNRAKEETNTRTELNIYSDEYRFYPHLPAAFAALSLFRLRHSLPLALRTSSVT